MRDLILQLSKSSIYSTKPGIGEKLLLEDNTQFILSSEDGGRLVVVQLLNN
ncbi:hypothetical protein [Klebsiella pneumoniae]|uniref:hypothetical protein n=1 Tax=Klebsiella pneumoniae TaxID=573 RepID=UPI001E36546C|nr:hypothetical protein [Klebsiella pneumoniae]UGM78515.1 hypothetical protein K9F37_26420 [Klebsiella pneumoniae]